MKRIILALALIAFAAPALAQTKPGFRLPIPIQPRTDASAGAQSGGGGRLFGGKDPLHDLLGALDAKLLPDLQYALRLAQGSGSKVTAPCYQAWITIIETRQKANTDEQGNPLPEPDPGIVTKFERMVELRNSLQPDSPFMIACSPVASMVKKDIMGFIGTVLSGGAGLATLVPGL